MFTATGTSAAAGFATEGPDVDTDNAKHFIAKLLGSNEVPPVTTDAEGRVLLRLSSKSLQLRYRVFVKDITGVTMAHIHCGAPGVNGPIVAFLFGPDPAGFDPQRPTLARGSVLPANVITVPDSAACPGGVASFDDLIAKIRAGQAYANVHTLANPSGAIRGQIEVKP